MPETVTPEADQPNAAMLERWAALPASDEIAVPMTRGELNDLIRCLRRLQDAVAAGVYAADAALSGGRDPMGPHAAYQASQAAVESMVCLTRFMNSFMQRAMEAPNA